MPRHDWNSQGAAVLNDTFKKKIAEDFHGTEQQEATQALQSITLQHVMAESQDNLNNAIAAILQISHGNLKELKTFVEAAKIDFRDVIYWAYLENQEDA